MVHFPAAAPDRDIVKIAWSEQEFKEESALVVLNRARKLEILKMEELSYGHNRVFYVQLPDDCFVLGFIQDSLISDLDEFKKVLTHKEKFILSKGYLKDDLDWIFEADFRKSQTFFFVTL